MNSMQSSMCPEMLVYLQFTLLAYAPEKSMHATTCLLYSTHRHNITSHIINITNNMQL